jgi:peptidoglycan/LPS O-acetylase OafA/YrhL
LTLVSRPTPEGTKSRRLVALDALRAVAVLLVLGRHLPPVEGELPPTVPALLHYWKRIGWMGVDLFFVLSGFLVAGLLFTEHARHGRIRPLRFLVRRGFKIYPGFYLLLGATWLWRHGQVPAGRFLAEALFVQNYFPAVWNHTWSLAIEEHFYLALTLLLWSWSRGREGPRAFRGLPGLSAVLFALVLALRIRAFAPFPRGYLLLPTHFRVDALLFGALLAYGWTFHRERLAVLAHRWRWAIAGASLVLLLPCLLLPLEDSLAVNTVGLTGNYLGFGGLVILVVASAARGAPRMERALAPLAPIGVFSYSIYLWHMPVALAVHLLDLGRFGWAAAAVVYLAGSLVVGIAAALAMEIPILRLRDRIIPSATAPPA